MASTVDWIIPSNCILKEKESGVIAIIGELPKK
jgi:hypothetical protein